MRIFIGLLMKSKIKSSIVKMLVVETFIRKKDTTVFWSLTIKNFLYL